VAVVRIVLSGLAAKSHCLLGPGFGIALRTCKGEKRRIRLPSGSPTNNGGQRSSLHKHAKCESARTNNRNPSVAELTLL
jgi:hypothetical protein